MFAQYTYLLLHLAALAGPVALSFDKKVAYYKSWKWVFPAMLPGALIFLVWDEYFTQQGVWSFNPQYIIGWKIGQLPIEEVLFFFTVPYCCLFIYACIDAYFPRIKEQQWGWGFARFLAVMLAVAGAAKIQLMYTAYTFILLAAAWGIILRFKPWLTYFSPALFFVAYSIILIPFLLVNGVLTALPVVLYNDAENLGIRITTIPFEDVFYGMLLILLHVLGFEILKHRAAKANLK